MDPAVLSAASALLGSLIGGISTLTASRITQREQFRAERLNQQAAKREALYAEFIIEASKRRLDAWSHNAETPDVLGGLYSLLERMRLTSSDGVIAAGEQVIRDIIDVYSAPDRSFAELRQSIENNPHFVPESDPLTNFSKACRAELACLETLVRPGTQNRAN